LHVIILSFIYFIVSLSATSATDWFNDIIMIADYYPQPVSYAPPAEDIIINQQPIAGYQKPVFGENSIQVVCPECQQTVFTQVRYEGGGLTWLICCILCMM
jgi:hypothetical protein